MDQEARERDALAKIRAHLDRDRDDLDRPLGSVREAAIYLGKTLPIVLGIVVLVGLVFAAALATYRKAIAPRPPATRAEYAVAAYARVEDRANKMRNRSFESLVGVADVSFRINPDGKVDSISIVGPRRDSRVDSAAMALIKAAEPFGRFPDGSGAEPLSLTGTWRFEGYGARAVFRPQASGHGTGEGQ